VKDLPEGRASFEALETTVENRLADESLPFQIRLHYLGAVFQDTSVFRKSEERRCPVSTVSVYSRVAFCVDSIAKVLEDLTLSGGFDSEKRIHYTFQQQSLSGQKVFQRGESVCVTVRSGIQKSEFCY
jgi:hypothetical protein